MGTEPGEAFGTPGRWPPPGAERSGEPDLPGRPHVVARLGWRRVVPLVVLPPLVYLGYLRLAGPSVPVSRLVNPGIIGLLVVVEVVLAGLGVARRGRPAVVGTNDWIAARGMFERRWRRERFTAVDRFSCRPRRRSAMSTRTDVVMADSHGQRVGVTLDADDPALPALVGRLRSVGAVEVSPRELTPTSRRRALGVSLLVLAALSLPIVYFVLGPLRVLPRSVAGAFTWSGCRASLAVEGNPPESGRPYVTARMSAAGRAWRLLTTARASASEVAQHTEDPPDRLTHLQADGFLGADRAYLRDPAGAVVDVETLRFSSARGAQRYDDYVNRAVCEDWFGRSGPLPTEVSLFRGSLATVRWLAGDSIVEVAQTESTPFPTPQDVEAVAAGLQR